MTKKKIEIKKIEKIAARQVTFSKRRKGLFKKAKELSTLCDAELALVVFSASGKLFDYSSNSFSIQELLERYNMHPQNHHKTSNQPSLALQLHCNGHDMYLYEEVAKKTKELRQMQGEDLQELGLYELKLLEKTLQAGLTRALKIKGVLEENKRLKQIMAMNHSSDSIINNCSSSSNSSQILASSDTSLKLGLPCPD